MWRSTARRGVFLWRERPMPKENERGGKGKPGWTKITMFQTFPNLKNLNGEGKKARVRRGCRHLAA